MQYYIVLLSETYGWAQQCTRTGLSLDITTWTTELRLAPLAPKWTQPSRAPQGPTSSNVSICVQIYCRKHSLLKINSLNNEWRLPENASSNMGTKVCDTRVNLDYSTQVCKGMTAKKKQKTISLLKGTEFFRTFAQKIIVVDLLIAFCTKIN